MLSCLKILVIECFFPICRVVTQSCVKESIEIDLGTNTTVVNFLLDIHDLLFFVTENSLGYIHDDFKF